MTQQFVFGPTGASGVSQPFLSWGLTLRGNPADIVHATGELRTVAAGQVADYATVFGVGGNHVAIRVNSIAVVGTITVTGAAVNPLTGIVTTGQSEVITVDLTPGQYYITDFNWWEVTSIVLGGGISVDYDIVVIGYVAPAFSNIKVLGYRLDMVAEGVNPDIRFRLIKVIEGVGQKITLFELENMAVNSGDTGFQIVDDIRLAPDIRSFNPVVTNIWENQHNLTLQALDFDAYFTGDEHHFIVGKNEGLIIRFEGAPTGGITNVDFVNLIIALENL